MTTPLLRISGLKTHFFAEKAILRAVDGVDLSVHQGEAVALVGESGCGKSTFVSSLFRIVPPPGRIVAGTIGFRGRDLLSLSERELNSVRGKEMSLVLQDSLSALNPVIRIGEQVSEILRCHANASKAEARQRTLALLERVHLPNPDRIYRSYPHQLSGGQRQRIMIAMAVACRPALIVADEPTSSLDVSHQMQIVTLLRELREEYQLSLLLITHDFGIVSQLADRVAVMYAGKVVEEARTATLFAEPLHPYTSALMKSIPLPPVRREWDGMTVLEGTQPDPANLPPGCAFEPRCPQRMDECRLRSPESGLQENGNRVSCFKYP